jgi:hypothetical protein
VFKTKLPAVRVAPARHGLGVFAERRLRSSRIIARVQGEIIRDEYYGSDYCMDLGPGMSLEPGDAFRFMNHSCEPNCELMLEDGKGESLPKMWVRALRDIEPDEELTIDYQWSHEHAIPCGCGSTRCRGWICDPADLPKLQAREISSAASANTHSSLAMTSHSVPG